MDCIRAVQAAAPFPKSGLDYQIGDSQPDQREEPSYYGRLS